MTGQKAKATGTGQWVVTPCGLVGKHRSGITLAVHQTLVVRRLWAQGVGECEEHPSILCSGIW